MFQTVYLGDSSEGVTPVPIPNTEVKPLSANGTVRETWWESRSLPGFYQSLEEFFEAFLFAPCKEGSEVGNPNSKLKR